MTNVVTPRARLKRDPAVRTLTTAWRDLTGGRDRSISDEARKTLIACSGGADSSALAIALAQATDQLVIAHVVHDLREAQVAARDRDATSALADRLGLPFCDVHVTVPDGNAEAGARAARYQALVEQADRHGCPFIATAHHADDELETLLMGLMRGSGPAGLGGIHRTRAAGAATIIRPMLDVDRQSAERICLLDDWRWQEDLTNLDTARLRAAVRHEVVPVLRALRPGVASRAAVSARLLRDAAGLIEDRVDELWPGADARSVVLDRRRLRVERPIVIGALLRRSISHLHDGSRLDRMGSSSITPIIEAIGDDEAPPRHFALSGIDVVVDRDEIRLGVSS